MADEHGATLVVDAVFGVVVTDALQNVAGEIDVVDDGVRGDFTGHDDKARRAEGFGRNAAHGVLREAGVEDGVGDLVGNLVGMPFADGFGSEKIFAGHMPRSPKRKLWKAAPNAMANGHVRSDALAEFVFAPQVVLLTRRLTDITASRFVVPLGNAPDFARGVGPGAFIALVNLRSFRGKMRVDA